MTSNAVMSDTPLEPHNMYPDRPWPRKEAYAGVLGKAAHAFGDYSEADPIGILFSLLALTSAAIGGGPHVFAMEDHPLITQVCLIGDKGFAVKGTGTNHARALFKLAFPDFSRKHVGTWSPVSGPDFVKRVADMAVNAEWFKNGVKLDEIIAAEENPLKWIKSRYPMCLIVQEWVNVIDAAKFDPNLDVFLRTSWQGDDLEAKMNKGWLRLVSPHIAIIGNTTPTEFLGTIGMRSIDGGSLTRMLIAFVHQVKTIRMPKRIPDAILTKLADAIRAGVEYGKNAGEVTWTLEAESLWVTPRTGIHDQLMGRVLGNPILKEFFSNRPRVHAPRLAATFALMAKRKAITKADITAAWAILDYAMDSVLFMFEMHGGRFANRFAPGMVAANGNGHHAPKVDGNASNAREEVTERITELLKEMGPDGMLVSAIQPKVRHIGKYSPHGPADKQAVNDSLAALKERGDIAIDWAPRTPGNSGRTGKLVVWVGPQDTAPGTAPESAPKPLTPPTPTQLPPPAVPVRQRASKPASRRAALPPPKRPVRPRA